MPSVFWINALKWGRSRTAATDRTDARVASRAVVAELVDARRSGRRELTLVEVRVLTTALARATLSHPEPPSSRGLGRRPLTAETGVRIPVAVLVKPAPGAGFSIRGALCGQSVPARRIT